MKPHWVANERNNEMNIVIRDRHGRFKGEFFAMTMFGAVRQLKRNGWNVVAVNGKTIIVEN